MGLHTLDDIKGTRIDADVAIVGAGAAGITMAMKLKDSGLEVALLEGGLLDNPGALASCYDGETSATGYPLMSTRLRFFGGTTNHWGGWCARLFPIDLEAREEAGSPGWPISFAQLETYYPHAERVCEISGDTTPSTAKSDLLDDFVEGLFRFSPPTRFGQKYRQPLAAAQDVTVYCDANLTGLRQTGERVAHATVRSAGGKVVEVHATRFVLAMGGIENARALLIQQEAGSLKPRGHGIGQYFMDHPGAALGTLIARDGMSYHRHVRNDELIMPTLRPSDSYLREHKIPSFFLMVRPTAADAALAPEYLTAPVVAGAMPPAPAVHYSVQANVEPAPVAESRISLSSSRDSLGLPGIHMDWQMDSRHHRDLVRLQHDLVRRLGSTGRGRFRPRDDLPGRLSTQSHHLGTTRMAMSAAEGVVDADCRVFGIENLYMAGSSTFPSAGCVNPTLTIVALSARLADHLYEDLS